MRVVRLALDQTGGLVLGLVIGAVLFFGGFFAATRVMDTGATHGGSPNIHACVSAYTNNARIMLPGQPPICNFGEYLVEWAGPGAVDVLDARLTALENQVPDCLSDVGGDAVFSGCNVEINNGVGTTSTANGSGNLIVGYNANSQNYARSGSHNVVVGDDHGYSQYGGIVAGLANQILGPWSTVTGGQNNSATKLASSVSGGQNNTASGGASSVSGGQSNQATHANASVSGGNQNTAGAGNASVTGGTNNTASGTNSSVNGGLNNQALNGNSTVSGGNTNIAQHNNATVAGGMNRVTPVANGWVIGPFNGPS